MKPRLSLILFSYAMLCLAGGISIIVPDSTVMSETATGTALPVHGLAQPDRVCPECEKPAAFLSCTAETLN
jgi:hypothetical protein